MSVATTFRVYISTGKHYDPRCEWKTNLRKAALPSPASLLSTESLFKLACEPGKTDDSWPTYAVIPIQYPECINVLMIVVSGLLR